MDSQASPALAQRLQACVQSTSERGCAAVAANGFEEAYWTADFTSWSFCLVVSSTALGTAVSLKYLITAHHLSRVVVHGRPGLVPHHRELQHASGSVVSTSALETNDIEHGLTPNFVQPALPASVSLRHSHRLGDTSYVMQAPVLDYTATRSGPAVTIQLAAPSRSGLPSESAFVRGIYHAEPHSYSDSGAPAELQYAPQVRAAP